MTKIIIKICLFLSIIFCAGQLFAQNNDTKETIDNVAEQYLDVAERQSVLYYGEIQESHPRTANHPFLKEVQYAKARLSYGGIVYPDEWLRLDWSRNQLVILSPDFSNIVLFPENLDYAEIYGYRIIYFQKDTLQGSPATGYYILLHDEQYKILAKETVLLRKGDTNSTNFDYSKTAHYYLYKDAVYHSIKNKRGLLKALGSHKKELRKFISINRLSFRNAEELLVHTITEYEKILQTD